MKLQDQVCSLELSKKLKELGVKQESLFYRVDTRKSWKEDNCKPKEYSHSDLEFFPFENLDSLYEIELHFGLEKAKQQNEGYNKSVPISAFTTAELGKILPEIVTLNDNDYFFIQTKDELAYGMYGTEIIPSELCFDLEKQTEANARAEMVVYLLENGLLNR